MTNLPVFARCCALLLAMFLRSLPVSGAEPARLGTYDFEYFMSGDARARPVQVFDDGTNTYFQFRAGEAVPAIFSARGGTPQLVVPSEEGPYLRVPQVHGRFVLQVGRAQAQVVHGAGERADAPAISVVAASGMRQAYSAGAALPSQARLVASLALARAETGSEQALDRNSYASPMRGDGVYWPDRAEQVEHSIPFARGGYVLSADARRSLARVIEHAGPSVRFTVIGRDDDSYKEGLERARASALRDALVKEGIASERITVRTGVMKADANGKLWLSTVLVDAPGSAPVMRPAGPRTASAGDPARPAGMAATAGSGPWDREQGQASRSSGGIAPAIAGGAGGAAGAPGPASAPGRQLAFLPEIPDGGFTLSASDRTVAAAVRRWAHALHYEVVWDAPSALDAAIAGEARLPARDLPEALEHLVRGLKEKGYALEVTIYANRVIRFSASGTAGPSPAPAPWAAPPAGGSAQPPPKPKPAPPARTSPAPLAAAMRPLAPAADRLPVSSPAARALPVSSH